MRWRTTNDRSASSSLRRFSGLSWRRPATSKRSAKSGGRLKRGSFCAAYGIVAAISGDRPAQLHHLPGCGVQNSAHVFAPTPGCSLGLEAMLLVGADDAGASAADVPEDSLDHLETHAHALQAGGDGPPEVMMAPVWQRFGGQLEIDPVL